MVEHPPDEAEEGETVISVRPDRSVTGKTELIITGLTDEHQYYSPEPIEEAVWSFTESLLDDLRKHTKKFPEVPFNYTEQKQDQCRIDQNNWIRELKTLLAME